MKKNTIFILLGFALILVLTFLVFSKPKVRKSLIDDLSRMNCKEVEQYTASKIQEYNNCEENSDCILVYDFGCLGCYHIINKDKSKAFNEILNACYEICPEKAFDCYTPQIEDELECINHKCTHGIFEN